MQFQQGRMISQLVATLLTILFSTTLSQADSVATKVRTVTKLAEGIYVIRHRSAPDTFPQGNTTVIIGDRDVLVVDSGYLPSSAQEDIAQIRQWTAKPVRYLLNTHWHYDHTMGNGVYADAFPGLAIIAHRETARQMAGNNPGWFARYPLRAERFQKLLDSGKDFDGNPAKESDRPGLERGIAGVKAVAEEFSHLHDRLPNLTFDQELDIDLGNREAQIKYMGRGHTAGDAVVYLPKEKIIIAGDLLDSPVPYVGSGFPVEEIETLQSMARLSPGETDILVPGHGDVLHGKAYLYQVIDFMQAVVAQVGKDVYERGIDATSLEDEQKSVSEHVDLAGWRKKFVGDDPDDQSFFDDFAVQGLVKGAYFEIWPR